LREILPLVNEAHRQSKIVLGLLVILVLCLLILWAALRKPLEHKKVFAMSSLVLRQKKGLRCCVGIPSPF
jgi:hypothetical protein